MMGYNTLFLMQNLPLIPRNISIQRKIEMAEKKLEFVRENARLFYSTGQYIMTLSSVEEEWKELKKEQEN